MIIGVGGFLGVGERYISVSFDKLKWSTEPVKTAAAAVPSTDGQRTVGSTSTSPPSSTSSSTMANSTATKSDANAWYPDHAALSAGKDEVKSMPVQVLRLITTF
ncbi:hypothetical protein [Bradyrhizobium prioriisuperbiae]|uniref:hypothetical protein n=1 Tax=Bradyrhizobium prioriisuperbiae TaxID=2854389 RepID=UPI0028EFB0ED|nr:hypothetical protein [Bradyrhizobium prioritasuperba]